MSAALRAGVDWFARTFSAPGWTRFGNCLSGPSGRGSVDRLVEPSAGASGSVAGALVSTGIERQGPGPSRAASRTVRNEVAMSRLAPGHHPADLRPRTGPESLPSFALMAGMAAAGALLGTILMLPASSGAGQQLAGRTEPQGSELLVVSPTAGDAGAVVDVSGRKFRRGQRGSISISDVEGPAVSFVANKRGRFVVTLKVPAGTAAGRHVIVATAADTNALLAMAPFSVRSGDSAEPTEPPQGDPTQAPSGPTPAPAPTSDPTPRPDPTSPPTDPPSPTPTPTPTDPPDAPSSPSLRWGLIGNDGLHLRVERAAGINTKLLELGWSSYEPSPGAFSTNYINAKKAELASLRSAGFDVILSFGVQYAPRWLLELPNARYVNQYGDAYADTSHGSGQANVIWNPEIRQYMARYMARVFSDLGTSIDAVRVGGGRFGELGYPVAEYAGRNNTYWAFDANAAKSNPVPGWKPGQASPDGEAGKFLEWYLHKLDEYQGWQIDQVRRHYSGRIMVLYPSFGIRPGQAARAVDGNLAGNTSPEINGEIQRGYDYARFVASVNDAKALVTTTWLNSPYGDDSSAEPGRYTPIGYLAYLAAKEGLRTYGENTGRDGWADMKFTAAQAERHGLVGFLWFNESEMFGGGYATLDQYASIIAGGP